MSRIRILRVITRMNVGGPAFHVSLLSGWLDSSYETLLVTGRIGPGEASAENVARRYGAHPQVVESLGRPPHLLHDLGAVVELVRLIRRFRPHIVHTHTAKAGFIGRVAALAVRPRPIIVHTYEGHVLEGYFGGVENRVYRLLERLAGLVSDALIGVSQATVDELVRLRVAPPEKFHVIRLGLDLRRFCEVDRAAGEAFRKEVGATPDDVLATYVGRLIPIKRVDVALRAIANARRRGAPLRLAVVGDGELRGELEALASKLELQEAVRFVGYRDDTPAIAAATDIALLTSDKEALGASVIEAAAAGRPAVATAVGGIPEVVCSGCGVLAPAGDHRALGSALADLSAQPETRSRMGERARQHARIAFSADRLLNEIDALYRELLAARSLS